MTHVSESNEVKQDVREFLRDVGALVLCQPGETSLCAIVSEPLEALRELPNLSNKCKDKIPGRVKLLPVPLVGKRSLEPGQLVQGTSDLPVDYKSTSLAVAAGTTVRVWDASSTSHDVSGSSTVLAKVAVSPTAISWNRNNKVAAVGLENGRVQIRYANGTCMTTLQDESWDDMDGYPVTSLSWSTGSKTLAVGSVGGRVSIHDMTTKQHLSKVIRHEQNASGASGKLKAVGLQHHPDDAFLAVGGKESVELYSLRLEEAKGSCVCSASSVVKNDASFSSVSVATGKPFLAAGSDKNGIVAVWDYVTEAELACDKFRHAHKGSTKVALAPLAPYLLYSVGMDGILKMQDLRLPSSIASPTAMASVPSAAGISSLSVHEYSGDIAVGTHDGYVYIFSAGLASRQATNSLFIGDDPRNKDCPVLAVDWARNYHNVTLHARQAVVESERVATPVSTSAARFVEEERSVLAADLVQGGEETRGVPAITAITASGDSKGSKAAMGTPERSLPSRSTSHAPESGQELPVRRTSTADPWQIRAANVVDGNASTPSSSTQPSSAVRSRENEVPNVVASVKKSAVQTPRMATDAAPMQAGGDAADDRAEGATADLSQLILALHLDMVQMHDAQSAEIRALREEVRQLKDELKVHLKPSGEMWGI